MSLPRNKLEVKTADSASEISVLDSRNEKVATGLGKLATELDAGIYKVHVRVGSAVSEQLVSLDQNRVASFGIEEFPTPVPLINTSQSHEYHMAAAEEASKSEPVPLGKGATMLIFSRAWSATHDAAEPPMEGLTLHDAAGRRLLTLDEKAEVRRFPQRDISAGCLVAVAPGAYRLRLTQPDKTASERILIAVKNWQTQIFMLMTGKPGERRPDLAGGPILMSRGPFDASGKGERVAVLARYALTQNRKITDAVYEELFDLKFEDPILGLLAAHLLLRDKPDDQNSLGEVMKNLKDLLGADHPDVVALDLRSADRSDKVVELSYQLPPMLRASWDLIMQASIAISIKLPPRSVAASIADLVLPTEPWLTWEAGEGRTAALRRARQRKLLQLASFVHGLGETEALGETFKRTAPVWWSKNLMSRGLKSTESLRGTAPSFEAEAASQGSGRKAPVINLDANVKAELTQSLGVTGTMLNAMLTKITL